MSNGMALGFYARHPLIMDELDDLYRDDALTEEGVRSSSGLPDPLVEFAISNLELLDRLLAEVGRDRQPLEDVYARLRKMLGEGAEISSRAQSPDWDHSVVAWCSDKRMTRARKVEFGWVWNTKSGGPEGSDTLFLDAFAWMQGGRRAEQALVSAIPALAPWLRSTVRAAADLPERWAYGVVRLDRIDVTQRVREDLSLDVPTLATDVFNCFRWIGPGSLQQLFKRSGEF